MRYMRMAGAETAMSAAAREARANAKEDVIEVTSGAKEKVEKAMASAAAFAEKMAHPFNDEAKRDAEQKKEMKKKETSQKMEMVREIAHDTAQHERLQARSDVASLVSHGLGGQRYPPPNAAFQPLPQTTNPNTPPFNHPPQP